MSGKGRFYGCLWKNFVPQVVGHEKGEKLSLAEVFLSPLTNLGMGSTVFTGVTGKNLPSRGRSRESGKIKPSGRKFSVPFTK